jgi:hypothetical protein
MYMLTISIDTAESVVRYRLSPVASPTSTHPLHDVRLQVSRPFRVRLSILPSSRPPLLDQTLQLPRLLSARQAPPSIRQSRLRLPRLIHLPQCHSRMLPKILRPRLRQSQPQPRPSRHNHRNPAPPSSPPCKLSHRGKLDDRTTPPPTSNTICWILSSSFLLRRSSACLSVSGQLHARTKLSNSMTSRSLRKTSN